MGEGEQGEGEGEGESERVRVRVRVRVRATRGRACGGGDEIHDEPTQLHLRHLRRLLVGLSAAIAHLSRSVNQVGRFARPCWLSLTLADGSASSVPSEMHPIDMY